MKILVAEGHHEDTYFRFSTPEEQKATALALFEQNDENEYYFGISDPKEFDNDKWKIQELDEEIKKAEAAGISVVYINKLKDRKKRMEQDVKDFEIEHGLYVRAKSGDATAAWDLIRLRKNAESEGFKIVDVK